MCVGNQKHKLTGRAAGDDKEVEEVTDMFADLAKKVGIYTCLDVQRDC